LNVKSGERVDSLGRLDESFLCRDVEVFLVPKSELPSRLIYKVLE
jgi:hypothetical protein